MKIKITLYSVILLLCTASLNGQNFYGVKTGLGTYEPLSNGTPITLDDAQGGGRYFSHDLIFKTFDHEVNFKAGGNSLGAYVSFDGYLAAYTSPSQSHTIIYHAILLEGSNTGLRLKNNSAMLYKYEGTQGNGILKVEWKNMGITNHHDSEYMNLQLWLDESDNSITYSYGPRSISGTLRNHVGLFSTPNAQFGVFDNAMYFFGVPQRFTIVNPTGFNDIPSLSELPENGRYFTFTTNTTGIQGVNTSSVKGVYPNPAQTTITLPYAGIYTITDITGKLISTGETLTENATVDVESLNTGIYYIHYTKDGIAINEKLIIGNR